MNRRGFLLAGALAPLAARAQDFESYRRQQRQGVAGERAAFADYQKRVRKAFAVYKREHAAALKAYRRRLERVWRDPELTDRRKWVEYGDDHTAQRVVDFGAGEIRIKVTERPGEDADRRAEAHLADLLGEDFATAFRRNPVDQQVERALAGVPEAVERGEPGRGAVLAELLDAPEADPEQARARARALMEGAGKSRERLRDGGWASVISVPLPDDRPMAKAREYLPQVRRLAGKQDMGEALVLAVMHTESAFNPMARSHVPAYGLMQIVPESAGRDATRMLLGRPRVLAPSYLYDPGNNIEIGTAYLHLLYYRYMGAVEDAESRLYCAIAAYNTGPGNVARTFTGDTDMDAAARRINRRSGGWVYRTLVRDLPYRETRDYLKRVARRMRAYGDL
ncbi:MAG TPA: transglycosylase SLT domain-containing protein [Gammaproteobacteria bacterium]|nr:transglycosylase SLT domain-containing protein [Gammaproteobacteria bacterium]